MKTPPLLPSLLLLLMACTAYAQTRTVLKLPPDGAVPNGLLEPLATGAHDFKISATGSLTFEDGMIINGTDVLKIQLGLNNVENAALSTWEGTSNIITLGTITTGTWQGSVIAPAYLGTGSSISSKFLRGDGTWQAIDLSGYQSTTGTLALGGFGGITGVLPAANGGTGVNNAGTITNANNTTITGGGTLALGGFTLTVPATGSAALLGTANTFTAAQTVTSLITSAGQITAPQAASSTTAALDFYAQTGAAGYPSNNDKWFTWSVDVNGTKLELMKLFAKDATTWGLSGPFGIYPSAIGPNVPDGTTQFAYGTLRFVVATVLFSQFGTTLDISKDDASYPFTINAANGSYHLGNTTSAQVLRVMGSYSSTTSFEAGVMDWQTTSNTLRIGSDVGSGGGSARDVQWVRGGVVKATLGANTTDHAQPVKLPSYIVSGLPSASTCGAGSMAFVTDATSTTAYTTVTGGGSNKVLVISDGTDWIIH